MQALNLNAWSDDDLRVAFFAIGHTCNLMTRYSTTPLVLMTQVASGLHARGYTTHWCPLALTPPPESPAKEGACPAL